MTIVNLDQLELATFTTDADPTQRCRATFPLLGANGTQDCATVYFELDPGAHLGRHTDSAEELLLVLQGEVEAEIDGTRRLLGTGDLVRVPKLVSHDVRNAGREPARVIGFFGGANNIRATFEQPWNGMPGPTVDTAAVAA